MREAPAATAGVGLYVVRTILGEAGADGWGGGRRRRRVRWPGEQAEWPAAGRAGGGGGERNPSESEQDSLGSWTWRCEGPGEEGRKTVLGRQTRSDSFSFSPLNILTIIRHTLIAI
jgi:hypothetical protein